MTTYIKTIIKREEWIDVLRGIAIFMVILGHTIPEEDMFFAYTSAIKMPLFFFLSGFLFSLKLDNITYFKKIFYRLIIPWFALSLLPYILRPSRFFEIVLLLLQGKRAWFMLVFTIDSIFVFFLLKYIKNLNLAFCLSLGLAVGGIILTYMKINIILCGNTILTTQLFIVSAYYLKQKYQVLAKLAHTKASTGFFVLIAYILICYSAYRICRNVIDVHTNYYFNIFYCIIMIISGNVSIFIIGYHYFNSRIFKPIAFLGKQSLTVYLLSGFYMFLTNPLRDIIIRILNLNSTVTVNVINSIMCCIVLSFISFLLSKYIPIINGEYKGYRKEDNLTI